LSCLLGTDGLVDLELLISKQRQFHAFSFADSLRGKATNTKNMANTLLKIKVDLNIYKQKVITSAIYKFTDRCSISQNKEGDVVFVSFQVKSEQEVNFDVLEKEFENELIDQQVRYDTEQKFGYIRNLIVEKAFSPVS
jgi:His-Xaa-Ser system protein HxsD